MAMMNEIEEGSLDNRWQLSWIGKRESKAIWMDFVHDKRNIGEGIIALAGRLQNDRD
jgi:hypothetical protein